MVTEPGQRVLQYPAAAVATTAAGRKVIAIQNNLDVDCCITFQLKNGRVTEGREYFFNLYAWDEFWS